MTDRAERDRLAREFEHFRPRLRSVAYRILGSMSEADDALQEAWLRLARRPPEDGDLGPWLTTVVGRICLDMLRARRTRREEYAGTWLPEPIVAAPEALRPDRQLELAEAIGIALLVVLETLGPDERIAFVLHDAFGVPFSEIAAILETTPAAARQLGSRARRRVRRDAPSPDADVAVQRGVVQAFLAAAREGDLEGLVAVLAPDVVLRVDAGGRPGGLSRPPLVGAREVASEALGYARFAALAEPVAVNGAPGFVVRFPSGAPIVLAFTVAGGRIAAIDIVADPAKLRGLEAPSTPR